MKNKVLFFALPFLIFSCGNDDTTVDDNDDDITTEVPELFQRFSDNVSVSVDGDFIVIVTDDVPDHPSPYFDTGNPLHEAYNGNNANFNLNPNRISSQTITFRIPINPSEAANKEATSLGAMGVSLNGVVFFNQYAGPNNQPLTSEIDSFDQYLGHPQQTGVYHYHQEPTYLTSTLGSNALLGWLLDGFPVYGPVEDGTRVNNSDLDDYHGHAHVTTEYPNGIYHYHITDADPYINGNGFYGVAGTVSN
ncbi:YHYH protein [Roseivirga sp. E12]|uniref:YHYH protein n=1 Tax=Roseivirga sp. E12 TaxID=2819237 RepID=UPI001ABC38DC|nr:YHYH protein [Roseivirga sp. E12]MBO3700654.1 YHYH protein [Roseivirga sp. E12]